MDDLIARIVEAIINPLILILAALAFLVFIWGLFKFISGADDSEKRAEGQKHILFGIIGLSIIVGAWGILGFLDSVIDDVDTTDTPSPLEIYQDGN